MPITEDMAEGDVTLTAGYPKGFIISQDFSFGVIIIGGLIAMLKIVESPKSTDYFAYYLYKIGDGFADFDVETNYIKKNQNYLKNCSKQISSLIENLSGDFIDDILDFFENLEYIILRLNYIYRKENIDEIMKKLKLNERRSATNDPFTPKSEAISSKLKDLANIIHKNHLSLTQEHIDISNKILEELKDIPEKPFQKSLFDYAKENWNKFPHNLKYLICGITIFVIFFIIFSQLLIYYKQEQGYSYALASSVVLTIFILPKIVSERDRKS